MGGIEVGGSRLSVLSAYTLFTVYSYKVVLVHSAVVTLYSPANPSTGGENFARLRRSNCLLSGQKRGSNASRISSEILLLKDSFRRQSNTLHNFQREIRGDNTLRLLLKPFFKELFTNKGEILSCKCVKACKN